MTKLNIIFAGTPAFAAVALDALLHSPHIIKAVYTQPDRPAGRGQKLSPSPVKEIALKHQLPVYQPLTLRDEKEQQLLRQLNADIMVVVAYGLILPKAILTAPRMGCINIHASLLPRWRGAAPIQRAILAGDEKTGVTIMQMDEGLDTGPLLLKRECKISVRDTSQLLHDRLASIGAQALLETLEGLAKKSIAAQPQDSALATYAHKITKEEAKINWNSSAEQIDRHIRAFNPSPIAFTSIDGQVMRIWEAAIASHEKKPERPGTLLQVTKNTIDVAAKSGIVSLTRIQLPGGKVLPISDVLNSKKELFKVGNQLA